MKDSLKNLEAPGKEKTGASRTIYGISLEQLEKQLEKDGFPKYRAAQIWHGLYARSARSWQEIPGIPPELRQYLESRFHVKTGSVLTTQKTGTNDETLKLLIQLNDGERIETVIIPSKRKRKTTDGKNPPESGKKNTLCVSSQVGCRFACAFCASGAGGFIRNLETGEIIQQLIEAAGILGQMPDNVVFMGVGEPLDNYENVMAAIRIINHPKGPGIGARRITISTCGIVPGIMKLAEEGLQTELSVSLHSCDNETRSKLMPVNRKYTLEALLEACSTYSEKTGRIITFEYTLIKGVNDSEVHAAKLSRMLRTLGRCRVNLIPLSPVSEFKQNPPAPETARIFSETLRRAGLNVTLRRSKGSEINAACGQLRSCAAI